MNQQKRSRNRHAVFSRRWLAGRKSDRPQCILTAAVRPFAESLERRMLLSASASMVADINQVPADSGISSLADMGNGKVVFFANDGFHGEEPFVSDGTAAGTTLIKDVYPGLVGSLLRPGRINLSQYFRISVVANGRLFFDANDGVSGHELWVTDGTLAGTTLVKDINPGSADSNPDGMVADGNVIFFIANDGTDGLQLWKSDGTSAGTSMVTTSATLPSGPDTVLGPVFNGRLFFTANDGVHGDELWSTDGTAAGTAMVADINPGSGSSGASSLTVCGSRLFFTANDGANQSELWVTDGTSAGTHLVSTLPTGIAPPDLQGLTDVNGTLFFEDVVDSTSYLYKSDGSSAGTVLVYTFNANSAIYGITDYGGRAYFSAPDGASGYGLWQSDGTTTGTAQVANLNSGELTVAGPNLFFAAPDGQGGQQLYVINSVGATPIAVSPAGSVRLNDPLGNPPHFQAIGSGVYFYGLSLSAGSQLWHSDGTAAGTGIVDVINTTTIGSHPSQLTEINGHGVFAANDTIHGTELWVTDGSAGGTSLLKDIVPGPADGLASNTYDLVSGAYGPSFTPVRLGNYDYFAAGTGNGQIWRTDGTAAGTTLCLSFMQAGSTSGNFGVSQLTSINGWLYFFADDGTGPAVYISDGTPSGTTRLRYLNCPTTGGNPSAGTQFFAVGNDVVFTATQNVQLWVTDGTPAGTVPLTDVSGYSPSSVGGHIQGYSYSLLGGPPPFVNLGSAAYFIAESQSGPALWRTDGTSAGTFVIKSFGTMSVSYLGDLTLFNGKLYFSTSPSSGFGGDLWTSDGTASGTNLFESFLSNIGLQYPPAELTVAGNTLYFSAAPSADDTVGQVLFASDGTSAGTFAIPGTGPGQVGYSPLNLTDVEGTLYFTARDQAGLQELWRVDQSPTGGMSVEDVWPATPSPVAPDPSNLVALDGTLFFQGTDQAHGAELWKLNLLQADAGGPYLATGNMTVQLDASGSRDPNPSYPLTYSWDLNGDGVFGDTTGVNPTYNANQFFPGVYPVTVQVTGSWQNTATATSYVTVPPQPHFAGDTVTFTLGTAVANASIQSWSINWGDGTPVENYTGSTTSVSHLFATASGTSPFMVQISAVGAGGTVEPLPMPVTIYADPVLDNGSLYLTGTSGNDLAIGANAGSVFDVGLNGAIRNYNSSLVSHFFYNDGGGDDQIDLRDSFLATLNLSSGDDSITNSGATAIVNPGTGKISLYTSFGTTTFAASGSSGIRQVQLSAISISSGAKVIFATSSATLGDYSNHANRTVAVVDAGGLNISPGGTLDMGDNDMILKYASANEAATKTQVFNLLQNGITTNGDWSGTGITSSQAAFDTNVTGTRALGWLDNADIGYTSFDGVALADANQILVKFTYYGDADLSGTMDGTDLSQYFSGRSGQGTGWIFADFDYDGTPATSTDLSLYFSGVNGYKQFGAL